MSALFVTGGSGFIGRRFLRRLAADHREGVYCLRRSPGIDPDRREPENLRPVTADLLDADRYQHLLTVCDTVVHLAAVTGNAPRAEYFRVNTEGTRVLLEASRRAGVARFLYVSSIAARFADQSQYYYAESKRQAEALVRASGLSFTIVRPTIVIGKGGSPWENLARLAALPVIPVLGRRTRIQPIYVDDVADSLCALLDTSRFRNETLELGGPEVTTFGDLLRQAHYLRRGRRPWTVGVPVGPVAKILGLLERFARARLPISAGQLAAFQNDGTVQRVQAPDPLPSMHGVGAMLRLVIENA
jgi:nucleoside-diphosphate-sugar epimerase